MHVIEEVSVCLCILFSEGSQRHTYLEDKKKKGVCQYCSSTSIKSYGRVVTCTVYLAVDLISTDQTYYNIVSISTSISARPLSVMKETKCSVCVERVQGVTPLDCCDFHKCICLPWSIPTLSRYKCSTCIL